MGQVSRSILIRVDIPSMIPLYGAVKWADLGFEIEFTQDGSPTLRLLKSKSPTVRPESMHHSGGALSETEFIYTPAIKETLQETLSKVRSAPPHFFILGLGLGYLEMIIARECLLNEKQPWEIQISSFESEVGLRESFLTWIKDPQCADPLYTQIAEQIAEPKGLSPHVLSDFLRKAFHSANLCLCAEFVPLRKWGLKGVDCYLYDAFSSKTNSELWLEDSLFQFLEQSKNPNSRFATYACTGNLKRALKRSGFHLDIQQGFSGKRDFTRAKC